MLISMTGKSGSGKSYIASLLKEEMDVLHIDIDKIGHKVNEEEQIKEQLIQTFGEIILENGKINRKKLGKIVFNSKEQMQRLEEITWHRMEEIIDEIIDKNPQKIILLDWQLLPKTKYFKQSDLRILVDAPIELRIKRAMKRDHITQDKFLEREKASLEIEKYQYDIVIENIEKQHTKKKVKEIYDKSIISRKF